MLHQSQVKSRVTPPGEHEGSAQRKPQGPARWKRVVGLWVCIQRPQQLYGPCEMSIRARARRCERLFSLTYRLLPRSCVCARELVSPFRSQKPAFLTWEARHSSAAGQVQGRYPS